MIDLEQRVAVITGAASGIGLALAHVFAAQKMKLVLADVERDALVAAAEALRAHAPAVLPVVTDVTRAEQVEQLAAEAYGAFGAVHILCNNAGVISEGAPVWEESLDNWDWVLGVNFRGVLHGVRAFVPRMLASGEPGHIVNTASVAGLTTRPLMGAYNVSKHAVVALSECLYAELQLASDRLQVSVLCPAFARTRLAEARRNGPPPKQADAVDQYGFFQALQQVVETGLAPESIAQAVLDAVLHDQFWVFPQASSDQWIRERFEGILARKNPPVRDLRTAPKSLRGS